VQRFGTKPAALCEFIKGVMEKEKGDPGSKEPSRFIVFSQWHSMLQLVARTLVDNGIKVRSCNWYPLSFCLRVSSVSLRHSRSQRRMESDSPLVQAGKGTLRLTCTPSTVNKGFGYSGSLRLGLLSSVFLANDYIIP
jgi:hypothetical protein